MPPRPPRSAVGPKSLLTQKALAEILGLNTRTVRQLTTEEVFPRCKRTQRYPLKECVQAYILYREGKVQTGEDAINYEHEKARLTRAQADRAELRRDRERGKLVPEAAARRAIGDIVVPLRQSVLALEDSLPPRLETVRTAAERKAILSKEIRSILSRLSAPRIRYEEGDVAFDIEPDEALHPDDPEGSGAGEGHP